MNQIKICGTCKIEKPLDEFYLCSNKKLGVQQKCKICQKQYHHLYNKRNTDKLKEYIRCWRQNNINKIKKYELSLEFKQKRNNRAKNKRKTDPNFKLLSNYYRRINHALKNNVKSTHTTQLLGCIPQFAKQYLEFRFKPGMTWENYGKIWHIDHIKPCSSFDLSKPEEQIKCFHYTNLQPLWATTEIARKNGDLISIGNLEKGDKII